jgi:O-antigen/teichoic acid export membrane protein
MNSLLTSGALCVFALVAYVVDAGPDQSGFIAFWTGVLLLALAVTAWSVLRADFGGAVAWGYIAVFVAVAPTLLALPLTHAASLWDQATCDPIEPCSPAGPGMWAPALLYAASLLFAWRAVRMCKADSPESGVRSPD